jgi:hypothetical protein
MNNMFNSPRYFWSATAIFMLPVLYETFRFDDLMASERVTTFLWQFAPSLVAIILYVCRAKPAAWGWLLGSGAFTYFLLIAVSYSSSLHSSIALFWAPVWCLVFIGPLGSGIALLVRKLASNSD